MSLTENEITKRWLEFAKRLSSRSELPDQEGVETMSSRPHPPYNDPHTITLHEYSLTFDDNGDATLKPRDTADIIHIPNAVLNELISGVIRADQLNIHTLQVIVLKYDLIRKTPTPLKGVRYGP